LVLELVFATIISCFLFQKTDPNSGYYLGAMVSPNGRDIAVLESGKFQLPSANQLTFKYYRSIAGVVIRVCQESVKHKKLFNNTEQTKECQVVSACGQCGSGPLYWQGALFYLWNINIDNIGYKHFKYSQESFAKYSFLNYYCFSSQNIKFTLNWRIFKLRFDIRQN